MREPVKGKSEAGRRRETRAHQTRQRIVDAARRLFLEQGYTATTVERIAREASVAPATVYQAFGTKQAILARILDRTVAGDSADVPLLDQAWVRQARQEPEASVRLALLVRGASRIAARTSPIKEVMRDAAASEPEIRDLIAQDHQRRLITQQGFVELITRAGQLRPGLSTDQAAATFFALVNSDTYRLLVDHLGWSQDRWQRWLAELLQHELLGSGPARPPSRVAAAQDRPSQRRKRAGERPAGQSQVRQPDV